MLNAVNIKPDGLLPATSMAKLDPCQRCLAIFVITVARPEAVLWAWPNPLSLYRNRETVDMERFNLLRW